MSDRSQAAVNAAKAHMAKRPTRDVRALAAKLAPSGLAAAKARLSENHGKAKAAAPVKPAPSTPPTPAAPTN